MATVIGLGVQFSANANGMTKGLSDADRAIARLSKQVADTGKAFEKFASESAKAQRSVGILAGLEIGRALVDGAQAIGNAFASVTNQIGSLVATVNGNIDKLNDVAARTGIGVEALQKYGIAAKLAGVDTEQFQAAVQKLGVNIGKAAPGDALDKSLRGINLSVQELRALNPEQQFSAIADAISQLPTAADRAGAAVEIFGKQGAALAPLFREGAAGLEELQARAERLGIIVSETQINNVAEMNDAFDLVRATIEGIIGQVIGNLAPAVTDVTNQFLKFVEEWSGAQGEGGTGIANAITDTLLRGAEYFAKIFDSFSENLSGVSESFAFTADVLDVLGKVFYAAGESLRTVFNAIQLGIDALLIGFGKLLEGIGSWVSSDLEQFGAGLAAASEESAKKNAAEMEAAASNAANTFNSIFTGGDGNAAQAGKGQAQRYLEGLRTEIENAQHPVIQVQTNLAKTEADLKQFLSTATGETSKFLNESVKSIETLKGMADAGSLTVTQVELMNGFMGRVNEELAKEKQLRRDAAEAAALQAEQDSKRIGDLLKTSDAATKISEDLASVSREQQRLQEQIAAGANDQAVARLAQLDQLQAKLEENQQAAEQGFGEGFAASFEEINKSFAGAAEKAAEFGQAGFDAAARLQQGIQRAQEQARSGILNKEAFDQEVARQQAIFDKEIKNIQDAARERARVAQAVDQLLFNNLSQEQQARINAAKNVAMVEQEIAAAQQRVAEARKAGDAEAVKAGVQRLQQLDQALAKEKDIANGGAARREQQKKLAESQQKQQEEFAKARQQQYEQARQQQEAFFEEQRKLAAAEADRQAKRIAALNTVATGTVKGTDFRTAEGAALVLDLAANAQDPQLIQARLQTKELQLLSKIVSNAVAGYLDTPVAIVGGARVAGGLVM